jgi:hypothetical protein
MPLGENRIQPTTFPKDPSLSFSLSKLLLPSLKALMISMELTTSLRFSVRICKLISGTEENPGICRNLIYNRDGALIQGERMVYLTNGIDKTNS